MDALEHRTFDTAALMAAHPPRWRHPHKRAVWDLHCAAGGPHAGELAYARWPERPLPTTPPGPLRVDVRAGLFAYAPVDNAMVWHVNFADPHLFVAYAGTLLAQDELQVLEHPALGALREALCAMGGCPLTVGMDHRPTPVTIAGVQRRCALDVAPDARAGRPLGLYGNRFCAAPLEHILAAVTPLVPPTISNILAMAAPAGGYGEYTLAEIAHIAVTAYSGFAAARDVSARRAPGLRTEIHTGFWGCGAFGGDRTIMTILQLLAAELAGVDLVFWTVTDEALPTACDSADLYRQLRAEAPRTPELLEAVAGLGRVWGVSDGN